MALREDLESARRDGLARLHAARSADELEDARVALLGRSGLLKTLREAFGTLDAAGKRELGPVMNDLDKGLKDAFKACQDALSARVRDEQEIDPTLPGTPRHLGSIHPISQVASEIEAVFSGMGFEVIDGPHVEEDEYNFGRLNIPPDHPARDSQDTFWLAFPDGAPGRLLRTHTSAVQSRTYPAAKPPFRKVVIGKVFRYEAVDATHDNTFTQVEGFVVDRDITVAHLVGAIRTMLSAVLQRDDVEVRLRPHFFPFVEPGFEVDVRCPGGAGRLSRWMELLGCGMIHPKVLEKGGIDPGTWRGFAFGLGLERLTMLRHGITDIRVFNGADLRSLHQFSS